MRLSADKTSPFYDAFFIRVVEVFLNGQSINGVIEAYEEAGMVRVYEQDANGRIIFDRKKREAKHTQKYGKVEIRLKPGIERYYRQYFEQKRRAT